MPEILLAEDNPADVYLVREALLEHKVAVTLRVVPTGQEVLRIITSATASEERSRLGLIILDLNLPQLDGIEILQHLRECKELMNVPVVVLTSSDSPRDRLVATQLGATCFLRKPSGLEQFLGLGAIFKSLLKQANASAHGI